MVVTILAIAFLVLIAFTAFVGYRTIIRRDPSSAQDINTERCTVCRGRFEKSLLVERQIGDYRLLYFCRGCIMELYTELGIKN